VIFINNLHFSNVLGKRVVCLSYFVELKKSDNSLALFSHETVSDAVRLTKFKPKLQNK